MKASVVLTSSNDELVKGFQWAKEQALAYVFTGDPVGDWYEAALPGREAFCMRDVAHQSTGAQVLGAGCCTRNILRKFAENISETRDWCSYWEIDRFNRPAPVDYRNDCDFWYNLPANFDVLHCCYRQYLWTGDRTYIDDPVFREFYDKTVNDYVRVWDKDGDGIPEHYPAYGYRGIATYNEEVAHPLIGGDLIALQFAAYLAYADLLEHVGSPLHAADLRARAQLLRRLYNNEWWNDRLRRFASYQHQDRRYQHERHGVTNYFPLHWGLVEEEAKASDALEGEIQQRTRLCIEERSYLPELFYAFGRHEVAYAELMEQMCPAYARREYPEVSFAAVGSIATGMMGIAPDARTRTIATRSRLTHQTEWVEMADIPVFENLLGVRHTRQSKTTLTNLCGPAFHWKAIFPGHVDELLVDGEVRRPIWGQCSHRQSESRIDLRIEPHTSRTVTAR